MTILIDEIALYEQAQEALSRGDLKQASGLCKTLMEQSPTSANAHHLMSSLFKATGNYHKAFDYAQKATQLDGCVAGYHLQQGHVLFALSDYEQAAESFKRAHDLSPDDVEIMVLLGNCMKELEHFDAATAWYEKAQTVSSDYMIHVAQADCYVQAGEYDKAEAMLVATLQRDPNVAQTYFHLGQIALIRGEFERSEYLFTKALIQDPEHLLARFYLSLLSIHRGDERQAINYLLDLLKRDPTHVASLLLLGNVFYHSGEMPSAKKAFHHVLAMMPDHILAWQNLLQVADETSQLALMMPELKTAIELAADPLPLKHLRALYRGDVPPKPPKEYVASVYNMLMKAFDYWIIANADMRHVKEVGAMLRKCKELQDKKAFSLLDLGCNLGEFAREFSAVSTIRVGVDVSAQTLKMARRSKLYDVLYELDVVEYVLASESTFDVIVAGGVLRWFGNLQPFFHALRNVMHHQSLCAFVVAKEPSSLAYTVLIDGRYQHSPAYIHDVTAAEGLQIIAQKDLNSLVDNDKMPLKTVYIIKKMTLH